MALLSEVMHEIALATGRDAARWTLSGAKFLKPVTPGMALTLVHTASETGAIRFEVRSADEVVATGSLSPT